jgi:hypothetical protein
MRNNLLGTLLAVGFMALGCGGSDLDTSPHPEFATREDALPDCNGQNYENTYYSDAAHTSIVGSNGCSCGAWYRWGRTSAFHEYVDYGACF